MLYFSIFAVTSMAGLNVVWFLLGLCSGGAKPAAAPTVVNLAGPWRALPATGRDPPELVAICP